jgi:hypothetical protein
MRRPTRIMLIVLFVLIAGAAAYQLSIASRDQGPLQGPTSPGQLPSSSAAAAS